MDRNPISVLYFTNSVVRGGAEEHILTLLRKLDRKVFRPILACPPECAEKLRPDLPGDVLTECLELQWPYQIGSALRLAEIIRKHRVGILHSHLFVSSIAASPIGWLCRVPVILETPHLREAWRHGAIKGNYASDRAAGRFVDHYVAVSDANARYLIEEKKLPAKKVHVIHNGCDLKKFDPACEAPKGLKNSLGFSADDPVVVVLGRLEPQKGHQFLLQAYAQVLREVPTARLVCVGAGVLDKELRDQCRGLGIENNVRFVGYQSNVADWLALADLTVLPSLFEGLPLVAIESLAAQRCVVATTVDGTTEVVINEQTGLTVPPANPQALAAAIVRLLRQTELRNSLAREGRQWVVENFSEERQIRKTEELYLHAWARSSREMKRRGEAAAVAERGARDADHRTSAEQPVGAQESR